jgi:hypothetical protein
MDSQCRERRSVSVDRTTSLVIDCPRGTSIQLLWGLFGVRRFHHEVSQILSEAIEGPEILRGRPLSTVEAGYRTRLK